MSELKELVGKRILFGVNLEGHDGRVHEGRVQGFSPNGLFVDVGYGWHAVDKVSVLDVLEEAEQPGAGVQAPEKPQAPTDAEVVAAEAERQRVLREERLAAASGMGTGQESGKVGEPVSGISH